MTFLLTHGYFEHGHVAWLQRMKNELLIHGDYNVIILDWLTGSGPPYTQATANTRPEHQAKSAIAATPARHRLGARARAGCTA